MKSANDSYSFDQKPKSIFAKMKKPKAITTPDGEFRVVVGIDTKGKTIHLCNMTTGNPATFRHDTVPYKSLGFNEDFFKELTAALEGYASKVPNLATAHISLILPDECISTTVLNVPTMAKDRTEKSVDVLMEELYKNYKELKVNTSCVLQNKQYSTFAVRIINQQLLKNFYSAFSAGKLVPKRVTYNANAFVDGLKVAMPAVANETFVFLHIGYESSYYSFVSKGTTIGYYTLPFGHKILESHHVIAENLLFNNPESELLVLNAMEKARAKQLTMMQSDADAQGEAGEGGEDDESSINPTAAQTAVSTAPTKVLPKKMPMKLPKSMMRPAPTSEQEYAYENFRIFIKWTLNLIHVNTPNMGLVKNVVVNLPDKYEYLFYMTNAERTENRVTFMPLEAAKQYKSILEPLNLFGGFYDSTANQINNF